MFGVEVLVPKNQNVMDSHIVVGFSNQVTKGE